MKGIFLDDNMSNLTSASNEAISLSSSSNRNEMGTIMYPPPPPPQIMQQHQSSFASVPITTNINQTQSNKKKRNLPGNPDPEAEVVALSPKSLMATNRFICEICNKGFQRDQNLQLHRRGHNLPWKLKQKSKLEVAKKKVYVCPEPSCVHHEPARALGDLTGIKKHFSRKHGEKKWKCDKCSKRYAVQSDWKAHSKICGTREYRCDCGTLFSRRDSFITHRAFCDALAEETHMRSNSSSSSALINHHLPPLHLPIINFPLKSEPQLSFKIGSSSPHHHQLPSWLDHNYQQQQNPNLNSSLHHNLPSPASSHMSATALLQKAAQMGVTMSSNSTAPPSPNSTAAAAIILNNGSQQSLQQDHMCVPAALLQQSSHHGLSSNLSASDHNNHHVILEPNSGFNCMDQQQLLHHHPNNSLTSTSVGSTNNIHEIFINSNMLNSTKQKDNMMSSYQQHVFPQSKETMLNTRNILDGKDDELTRDFLGLRGLIPNPTEDHQHFIDMAAARLDHDMMNHHHHHQLN